MLKLAHNTSLTNFRFPYIIDDQQGLGYFQLLFFNYHFLLVSSAKIQECFALNRTLVSCQAPSPLIDWFATLNSVCKEVGASELQRNSVPQGQLSGEQIVNLLEELKRSSEPWKKMRLIVLGHGRIGKTTLLKAIHNLLDPSLHHQVLQ